MRGTLSSWVKVYGFAAIAFAQASAISFAAVLGAIWAILTSGQHVTLIAAVVAAGAIVWTIVAGHRLYRAVVRGYYKRCASDGDRRRFGFWLGTFVSFIGLFCWAWNGLRNIDL